jgi:hypothetical protein
LTIGIATAALAVLAALGTKAISAQDRYTLKVPGGLAFSEFKAASKAFRPATVSDQPPQANDAKCGFACHTKVQARDYFFTEYAER